MKENIAPKQNKMGVMPVPKLMLNMALPMILSMVVQALYNVVDTFFVSHMADTAAIVNVGDKAINALTLAFPIQMLMIALGVGTGVGINAALSRSLGQRDMETASHIAGNAVLLGVIYSVVITIFGIFGAEAFISSQTSNPVIAEFGTTYLRIVTLCSVSSIMFMNLEKIVQATGNTVATMVSQLSGAITNIILDPIMIYGWLGLPAMGVAGAAWATVIGQFVSLGVTAYMFLRRTKEININVKYLIPSKAIIGNIYAVGAPAIVMQILSPIMTYSMNIILGGITEAAVTAYGVYYKLQNFIFMAAYGLNNASIPIISYNYGAGNKKRISDAIKYGLIYVCVIMLIGVALLQIFASPIVSMFSLSEDSMRLCIISMRIITFGFVFVGANVLLQGVCQALGNGLYSLIVSAFRMVIIVLPLAWFLSTLAHAENLVWIAFPVAEASAFIAAVLLTRRIYRKRVAPMGKPLPIVENDG